MITYNINGIIYLHIQQFVDIIGRSQQSTRHLLNEGNSARRMKYFRDGLRIMIPVTELVGFPFVNQGKQVAGKDIYHYKPFERQSDGTEKEYEGTVIDALAQTDVDNNDSDIVWRRCFCEKCTYTTEKCLNRIVADSLEVPHE